MRASSFLAILQDSNIRQTICRIDRGAKTIRDVCVRRRSRRGEWPLGLRGGGGNAHLPAIVQTLPCQFRIVRRAIRSSKVNSHGLEVCADNADATSKSTRMAGRFIRPPCEHPDIVFHIAALLAIAVAAVRWRCGGGDPIVFPDPCHRRPSGPIPRRRITLRGDVPHSLP